MDRTTEENTPDESALLQDFGTILVELPIGDIPV
jgi:hypothetical protein